MAKVSIVMPAYNRADTILRSIRSVQDQTVADWELIVIDDGSTDGTSDLVEGIDPRLVLIRQPNGGFVAARNTGLSAATGDLIAFLDSDDEWLPQHLELCLAFLDAHPQAAFVATELSECFGRGRSVNHYRAETSTWYPDVARLIRSRSLALPDGESDDYLRFYSQREPIGSWGRPALAALGAPPDAYHYSGQLFDKLRWGYLIAVNSLVIRRQVLDTIGLEDKRYNTAADYHFTAKLCERFTAHYLSVPTYIKHEFNDAGEIPRETHLATGKTALVCAKDMLNVYDDLFWRPRQSDPELRALRGVRQLYASEVALRFNQFDEALMFAREARANLPQFWKAAALHFFLTYVPTPMRSAALWHRVLRVTAIYTKLVGHALGVD